MRYLVLTLVLGCSAAPLPPDLCGDARVEPSGACVVTPTHPPLDLDGGQDAVGFPQDAMVNVEGSYYGPLPR